MRTAPRIAVVTGSAGGIGRATVAALREEGWMVVGIDRSAPPDLDEDVHLQADLSQVDEVDRALVELRTIGHVTALVNNAAVQVHSPLETCTDAEWDLTMNTNVRAAFLMMRALIPALRITRGAIVSVGSVHAIATSPNVAAYAVSKAALAALTRTAAVELAPDGIRCNTVLPGAVDTRMFQAGLARTEAAGGPATATASDVAAKVPLGFIATPEQIAPTIVHLCDGERSAYTTGQVLVVDGGVTSHLRTE